MAKKNLTLAQLKKRPALFSYKLFGKDDSLHISYPDGRAEFATHYGEWLGSAYSLESFVRDSKLEQPFNEFICWL